MASVLLAAARQSRHSPVVLKTRIISIRSRDPKSWIFVYEGKDDVGVYDEWLRSIDSSIAFRPIAGNGKGQILALRQNLHSSTKELRSNVLFFIDHDFDGLQGQKPGADLFCTSTYSIENYFVSTEAVRSILDDELRCAHEGDTPDRVIAQFERNYDLFLREMAEANLRIYCARMQSQRLAEIEDRIAKYVRVELTKVSAIHAIADLDRLIPVPTGATLSISMKFRALFSDLKPRMQYRGKFAVGFFTHWMGLVFEDRRSAKPILFDRQVTALSFSPQTASLRSLASRCSVPSEFRAFIERALGRKKWWQRILAVFRFS